MKISIKSIGTLALVTGVLLTNLGNINQAAFGNDYSEEVSSHLNQGIKFMQQDQLASAKQEFESAIKLEPECPEAFNNLGLCYLKEEQLEKAKAEFNTALQINPDYLPSLNNMGALFYRQHNNIQAALYYKRALSHRDKQDSDYQVAEILTNLANATRDNGDIKSALSFYIQAIQSQPDYAPAYNNMGLAHSRLNDDEQAVKEIAQAIKLKPAYSEAYYNLGLVYRKQNKLDEAIAAFESSLQYETNPAYALDTKNYIVELHKIKALYEQMTLAYSLLKKQEWKTAQLEYQKILSNPSDNSVASIAWNNLGVAYAGLNNYSKAIDSYTKALALKSPFAEAHYNLGQAFYNLQEPEKAEKEFRLAIQQAHGKYALSYNMLGILLKQKGNFSEASNSYKLAIAQSNDTLPVVHFNLGKVLINQNKKSDAAQEFKAYLQKEPSGTNSAQAKLLIKQLSSL